MIPAIAFYSIMGGWIIFLLSKYWMEIKSEGYYYLLGFLVCFIATVGDKIFG